MFVPSLFKVSHVESLQLRTSKSPAIEFLPGPHHFLYPQLSAETPSVTPSGMFIGTVSSSTTKP